MSSQGAGRIRDELAQAWTVAVKDVRVYYLRPGMIMFGFLMPFFMFFSFSVRRELGAAEGLARLLALTVFFTAGAAGPSSPCNVYKPLRTLPASSALPIPP